jgi:hypothetical protein
VRWPVRDWHSRSLTIPGTVEFSDALKIGCGSGQAFCLHKSDTEILREFLTAW